MWETQEGILIAELLKEKDCHYKGNTTEESSKELYRKKRDALISFLQNN